MADEKKTEKKAAAADETPQQTFDREHGELVEARKAAERAVFEHRNPSEEAKEAAKAATKTTVESGVETVKKGAEKVADTFSKDDDKGAAKGPLAKGTEGYEKGAWPK